MVTVLMYLQTPIKGVSSSFHIPSHRSSGGDTIFPEIGLVVPAVAGNAVLFYNINMYFEDDMLALHAGLPVEEGEKWAAVKWMREEDRGYR